MKRNAAFVGGGLRSVIGLGVYSLLAEKDVYHFTSFSGASIGSVIAICLAAGKSPKEIRNFLISNVEGFCIPILGNKLIEKKVNEYLDYMLYKDLPMECIVSVTPLRKNVLSMLTRENSENLTVGEVAALSSSIPGLFLPRLTKLGGKYAFVIDGGFLYNPPLNDNADENLVFSYWLNEDTVKFSWDKRRLEIDAKADILFNPKTKYGMLGKKEDVFVIYDDGRDYALSFLKDFQKL
ncbi:MAG: patatin-like phospholipase family protein [Clostridia bacterium]|nr:patatin-like phospholipase family protein [Clostridia bacterium]